MSKVKLYIVDIEESTINRLEELFYSNVQLGIKVHGYSHNYNSCINDLSWAKEADVFLISAYLPDTMGVELIAPIKKIKPDAKIIMMLNKKTHNLAEEAMQKGADTYLSKPYKAKELIDSIHKLMASEEEEVEKGTEEEIDEMNESYYSFEQNEEPEEEMEEEIERERKMFKINTNIHEKNEYEEEWEDDIDEENEMEKMAGMDEIKEEIKKPKKKKEKEKNHRSLLDVYSSDNPIQSSLYQDEDEIKGDKPNIVTVFSSPTSAGKTTLLVNTAVAIQKYSAYKPKICIVDFNLIFPSVLYKFHQDDLILCKRNIYDICEDIHNLDEDLIKQALITHEPTGIKILETPSDLIRDLSRINPDTIGELITHLREMFDLVLIDTSSNIREDWSSFPLTIADKGIVVVEPDLTSLLHTRKFIGMMKEFEKNLPERITNKFQYVLNKESQKAEIHTDTIKRTLFDTNVRLTIPEDTNVTYLGNRGQFFVEKNYAASKGMKELARMVYPFDRELYLSKNKDKKQKGSLFGSIFKKNN
jgi:septum formation inhibitor-activating ATPase MinD/DNA-binding NarL/FixJ family response regulator